MRIVQVLEEMATSQAVQTVLGDFPSGNSPEQADLSRLYLEEIRAALSWGLFQPVLFCDYPEGALYGINGTAVSWSHNWRGKKNLTNPTKKPSKPPPSKNPQYNPSSNISYVKTGASIDVYILRTEWSAHSPSRVLFHPVARHAKWEKNTEEFCMQYLKMRLWTEASPSPP